MFCVEVAINLPINGMFKTFTYGVKEEFSYLDEGWRVVVPFGAQTVEGFVVRRLPWPEDEKLLKVLKNVSAVIGQEAWFDKEMLATSRWLSEYYMCTLAEAMRIFVPGKSSIRRKAVKDQQGKLLYYEYAERLKEKTLVAYRIKTSYLDKLETVRMLLGRSKAQLQALEKLSKNSDWLTIAELKELGITTATVKALLEKGIAEQGEKRVLRNSYQLPAEDKQNFILTEEQQQAVAKITQAIDSQKGDTFLLQGITGSGKTEVYLRAAAQTLAIGKQVLVLVPEIALTAQLVKRFQSWFGDDIAVAHSKLSQNERGDVWYKLRTGKSRILIGVRSAVFAPFEDLGLIIIDEEHESSYKQDERPGYHAREVALCRCKNTGATLVLGSATPDLCSYQKALLGEYAHLKLTQRPNGAVLPKVSLVDMRAELAAKNYSVLSRELQQEIVKTAAMGEQAIILLNRRGYSTFTMCRDCGTSITCPHCAVAMVAHVDENQLQHYGEQKELLRCHYCGNSIPVPQECPSCHSRRIRFFGTGTQKAQRELMALPEVKVLRMDQDSTGAKLAHLEILERFSRGSYNTLIGTQMVAKGHDIPNVTLVGVLTADSSLNLPDYRASERTFALLTQAAGRAGRGEKPGKVVLQAYDVENKIIKQSAAQDYESFANDELKNRELLFYPPFSQILKITVWDKEKTNSSELAQRVAQFLQQKELEGCLTDLIVMGPFPAMVEKVRDQYRTNLVVKAKDMSGVKRLLQESEFRAMKNVVFEVDPLNTI